MRGNKETKGKLSSKGFGAIVLSVCVIVLLSSVGQVFSQTDQQLSQNYVTPETMQSYAQTLINTYIQLSNQYFPSNPDNLTFYSGETYSIKYYSSSQGGVALWIEPAETNTFETIYTKDRIEEAVFGKADWSLFPLFYVGVNITLANFAVDINNHPFIQLAYGNSSLLVHNILVNSTSVFQAYSVVVIKASNKTASWSPELASYDSLELLKIDVGFSFAYSQEFTQLSAIPAITAVLKHIKDNLKNSTYTEIEYLADLQKIRDLANQFGISTIILNELRGFVEAKDTGIIPIFPDDFLAPTVSPSPTATPLPDKKIFNQIVIDPQNIWYVSLLSLAFVLEFAFDLYLAYYKTTNKPLARKILLAVPPAFLIWFISDAVYYRPYDLNPIQIFVIAILSLIGITLVYTKRKLFRRLAVRTKGDNQKAKNNSNKKANDRISTE